MKLKKKKNLKKALPMQLDIYYDVNRSCFWVQNPQGQWIKTNETSTKRRLKKKGLCPQVNKSNLSEIEDAIIKIEDENSIDYAGSLAGYPIGIHEISGKKILITEERKQIIPQKGEFPIINQFLEGLLGTEQLVYFYGWLKVGFESLENNHLRPGQAVVLAGPRNCGKSLLQHVITQILGGRAAKPYQYMTGGTSFNSDLLRAEHLMIEDEVASADIRARRNFGTNIKNICVNQEQRCHAKNREAVMLTPFWRLSISLNDEAEDMLILPVLDDGISDKLILFKVQKRSMPMSTISNEDQKKFWDTLISELPAFLYFLKEWEIPQHLQCPRFGIKHFHHPDLIDAIDSESPEMRLLQLIDEELFKNSLLPSWKGKSTELESMLTKSASSNYQQAQKLLRFNNAAGTYLGRLARKHPKRVTFTKSKGYTYWKIYHPAHPNSFKNYSQNKKKLRIKIKKK